MVNSLRHSLHTVLPRSAKFLFELIAELLNTVFLIKVHVVDVTGFIDRLKTTNYRCRN